MEHFIIPGNDFVLGPLSGAIRFAELFFVKGLQQALYRPNTKELSYDQRNGTHVGRMCSSAGPTRATNLRKIKIK